MKIALLAPSGAGKTAYLTGLYGVSVQDMNEDPSYGIHFAIPDTILNAHLDRRFTDLLEQGDFGDGSKDITVYPVALTTRNPADGQTKKLAVEIVDFPGGDLHAASEERREKIEEIIQRLSECDGFIVLLDGEQLIQGAQKQDPRILRNRVKANAIKEVLTKALDRRRAHTPAGMTDPNAYAFGSGPTPVVFALTKGDKVEDWLASSESSGNRLEKTVRGLFNPAAGEDAYAGDEGRIANFIRSQFGQIIDAPDIVSARTCVTVYNETEQRFDPRDIESLFQFVLFAGLCNAGAEYERRYTAWKGNFDQKDRHYSSETSAYYSAVAAKDRWMQQPIWDDIADWWNGRSVDHHAKVASYHSDMARAASARDNAMLPLKQVEDNRNTLNLFFRRVLSDRLVYLLDAGNQRQKIYQKGLPIEQLSGQDWWKSKRDAGSRLIAYEQSMRMEPDGP